MYKKLAIHSTWYPFRTHLATLAPLSLVDLDQATFDILLGGVKDVSSSDGTSVHLVVYHLELGEPNDLEGCLDQPTSKEFDSLCTVLAVADVRAWES